MTSTGRHTRDAPHPYSQVSFLLRTLPGGSVAESPCGAQRRVHVRVSVRVPLLLKARESRAQTLMMTLADIVTGLPPPQTIGAAGPGSPPHGPSGPQARAGLSCLQREESAFFRNWRAMRGAASYLGNGLRAILLVLACHNAYDIRMYAIRT